MLHFYEIKCSCVYDEWRVYIYVVSHFTLRDAKEATTNKVPKKVKLLIEARHLHPIEIRALNFFEYLYYKYIEKDFHFGARLNWEKEEL